MILGGFEVVCMNNYVVSVDYIENDLVNACIITCSFPAGM
jgi:hypothetical protein